MTPGSVHCLQEKLSKLGRNSGGPALQSSSPNHVNEFGRQCWVLGLIRRELFGAASGAPGHLSKRDPKNWPPPRTTLLCDQSQKKGQILIQVGACSLCAET